jgi:hypothetical protein
MIHKEFGRAVWLYNVSAVLILIAGWWLANVVTTKAAQRQAVR